MTQCLNVMQVEKAMSKVVARNEAVLRVNTAARKCEAGLRIDTDSGEKSHKCDQCNYNYIITRSFGARWAQNF